MTLGELVVQMRLNSAAFNAEMENVGKKTKKVGKEFGQAQNLVTGFAKDGLATIIPAAAGAEVAIASLLRTSLVAGPPLIAMFGKVALVIGAAIAAYKAGQMLGRFLFGEDEATKAQQATLAAEKFWIVSSAIRRREAAQRAEALKKERDDIADHHVWKLRNEHRVALESSLAQQKAWIEETTAFRNELQKRLAARQSFEANLGQGGLPGGRGLVAGLAAVRQLNAQLAKDMMDLESRRHFIPETDYVQELNAIRVQYLAQIGELRQEFHNFPVVLDALQRASDKVDFGNLGLQAQTARDALAAMGITVDHASNAMDEFNAWLDNRIPSSVRKTIDELNLLNQWLAYTTAQFQAAEQAAKDFAESSQ